jgi:integrase
MGRRKNVIARPTLVKDRKTGLFQVAWTDIGTGYTRKKSTGERDRMKAEQVMRTMAGLIVAPGPTDDNYTMTQLLAAYEVSRDNERMDGISDSDARAIKKLLEYFAAFTPDKLIDSAWRGYRKWRTAQFHEHAASHFYKTPKKISDATACRELNVMRAAIVWAKRDPRWRGLGHVRVILPNAERNARLDFLTEADAKALVANCMEPHTRLFVLLALGTAARHRAVLDLKWSAVKWPNGVAPTDGDAKRDVVVRELTKGNAPKSHAEVERRTQQSDGTGTRYVSWGKAYLTGPIHLDLGKAVGNKRKPVAVISPTNVRLYSELCAAYNRRTSDYVIEWRGGKIDRVDLSEAYRRAGIKKPGAPQHVLKHTAISWMVQAGKEIAKIAALTQTSVQTIEKTYGHLSPQHYEMVGDVLTVDV